MIGISSSSLLVFAFRGISGYSGIDYSCQRRQHQQQQQQQQRQRPLRHSSTLSFLFATTTTKTNSLLLGSISSPSSSSLFTTTSSIRNLEVCMSPGCIADGADQALLKLQALSSSSSSSITGDGTDVNDAVGVVVKPGVCCSLCGNGPVVFDKSNNKKYRNVLLSNDKILDIVLSSSDDDDNVNDGDDDDDDGNNSNISTRSRSNMNKILDGINLYFDGDKALKSKDYITAIEKYTMAIDIGMKNPITISIIEKQQQQQQNKTTNNDDASTLNWLINAYCNKAKSKLFLNNDVNDAIICAEKASELSLHTSIDSFIILQEAYQKRDSSKADDDDSIIRDELHALQSIFDLLDANNNNNNMRKNKPIMDVNKRRTLAFRLTKLQQQAIK
ncbi:hypothetical protein FRACYDRAFT_244922 [Fragilariopsis cylindrus CCMP1102]|uniref:TPR-like protein n=1 Tax=Fragilariopsis cylindrus CCMP1102 TaxID=635003 RepID=A0A1E7F0P3_9STRA|nr:hypothetical protein FRACYDRAFT_244922 [Fragilariopsis cylindrus CCMP1102]|eukprot:OEU11798.1 hypothetical protein FRACYDRAFT_244922 [Fragilariopsis cylindrus CCMP1102]